MCRIGSKESTNPEPDIFDSDNYGNKCVSLLPQETLHIPFKYLSYKIPRGDISKSQDSNVITVNILSGTYGNIVATIKLAVILQRCVINRAIRFFEHELSTLTKSVKYIANPDLPCVTDSLQKSRRFVQVVNPASESNGMSRFVVDWRQLEEGSEFTIDIKIRLKCDAYPENYNFFILIYKDPYSINLIEVNEYEASSVPINLLISCSQTWEVFVNTCQRIDIHGNQGSTSHVDLMVRGDKYIRRVKLYANLLSLGNINFTPRGVFNLVPGAYTKLSAQMSHFTIQPR